MGQDAASGLTPDVTRQSRPRELIPRSRARLCRWTFDLTGNTDRFTQTYLDDLTGEFPGIDDRRAGLVSRHGWYACAVRPALLFGALSGIAHVDGTARAKGLIFCPARAPNAATSRSSMPRTLPPARSRRSISAIACPTASTATGSGRRRRHLCDPWLGARLTAIGRNPIQSIENKQNFLIVILFLRCQDST